MRQILILLVIFTLLPHLHSIEPYLDLNIGLGVSTSAYLSKSSEGFDSHFGAGLEIGFRGGMTFREETNSPISLVGDLSYMHSGVVSSALFYLVGLIFGDVDTDNDEYVLTDDGYVKHREYTENDLSVDHLFMGSGFIFNPYKNLKIGTSVGGVLSIVDGDYELKYDDGTKERFKVSNSNWGYGFKLSSAWEEDNAFIGVRYSYFVNDMSLQQTKVDVSAHFVGVFIGGAW